MSKARKNDVNKDIPEERITLRVLKNYSKMQEELCHLRKKTRELILDTLQKIKDAD